MGTMDEENLYLAGHPAPAGRYRRLDSQDSRLVVLERTDVLPASFDGQVAVYRRHEPPALRPAAPRPARTRGRTQLVAVD